MRNSLRALSLFTLTLLAVSNTVGALGASLVSLTDVPNSGDFADDTVYMMSADTVFAYTGDIGSALANSGSTSTAQRTAIYSPTKPAGTTTVSVISADLCKDTALEYILNGTGQNAEGNGIVDASWAHEQGKAIAAINNPNSGNNVTSFSYALQSDPDTKRGQIWGHVETGAGCNRNLDIPTGAWEFDYTSMQYKVFLLADGLCARKVLTDENGCAKGSIEYGYANMFRYSAAGFTFGFVGGGSFGIDAKGRHSPDPAPDADPPQYGEINLPFAPICRNAANGAGLAMGTPVSGTISLTDPDNNGASAQPAWWHYKLHEYNPNGTNRYVPNSEVTTSGMQFTRDLNGANNAPSTDDIQFYPSTGGGTTSLTYDFKVGYKYVWEHNHVSDNNTVTFKLPLQMDSINYDVDCRDWTASPSSSASAGVVIKGTTVNFTHRVDITGNMNTDRVITATRYINGVASGAAGDSFTVAAGTAPGSGGSKAYAVPLNSTGKYCESVGIEPSSRYDSNPAATVGAESCVYIIDPTAITPTSLIFEKGETGPSITVSGSVDNGGSAECPATGSVSFTMIFNIPGVGSDSRLITYGNGVCDTTPSFVFPIANTTPLNDTFPGKSFDMTTTVVRPPQADSVQSGTLQVIEVPFARFYGNDIFARNGDIRFNAAPGAFNSGVGGQGSVSQFGAFNTTATKLIATAAFRFGLPSTTAPFAAQTQPDDGLRATVPAPSPIGTMIDKIQLPTDCRSVAGNNLTTQPAPYTWGSLAVYQKQCYNVAGPGPINITPTATPWSYRGKYTIKTADNVDMYISQNFTNNTAIADYADPNKTGVLMLISGKDIYIDKSVSRVDAILLAKGTIYTCAENGTTGVTVANRDDSCRASNLTINGVVAAPNIRFERSVGTRLFSNENDHGDIAGIQNIASRGSGYNNTAANTTGRPMASEIVNFPAYLYFSRPYLLDTSDSVYTALFNAAPRY